MRLKARVIALLGHEYSRDCATKCIQSAEEHGLSVRWFPATPKEEAEVVMKTEFGLRWTFPVEGKARCTKTGLVLRAYNAKDIRAKYGCAMSHYRLWRECAKQDDPYLILEHDAVFLRPLPPHALEFTDACMVNDPRGATPKGGEWGSTMKRRGPGLFDKTHIFPDEIPDGLAGHSAYLIRPHTAALMVEKYHELGVWPNDATMCRQLVPGLQECYPFVTKVEQTQSTTAQ